MLKKVLKYEWISTGRILVILHIALALVTLLGNIEVGYLKNKMGYLSENGGTALSQITTIAKQPSAIAAPGED